MNRFAKVATLTVAGCALTLGGAGAASAHGHGGGAEAEGFAAHSPGFLSGNLFQNPIHSPLNICGNSVNVEGALNPAFGNVCINM